MKNIELDTKNLTEESVRAIYNKEDIAKMSWAEIQDVMKVLIKAGTWDKFVAILGKPLHVIKYEYMIEHNKGTPR